MELLPAIDILGGKAVRLAKGDYNAVTVYNDDPVAQAQQFRDAGASWIHVVDLDGARSGKPENINIIEQIIAQTGLQIEVGGGVRTIETLDRLVAAGASRVVLGTSLITNPEFTQAALKAYPHIVTAGIDAKDGEVAVAGWREGAGVPAEELVAQMGAAGVEHLVFTDIARDGMQTGIDAQRYANISRIFGHPVIASGGVATLEDVDNLGAVAPYIEGIITGRAVYEGSLDVKEALSKCAMYSA